MILMFFNNVTRYVISGINFRAFVNKYKLDKSLFIKDKYKYKVIPVDFVSVRQSYFTPGAEHGGPGDYAHFYLKVNDIYPFENVKDKIIRIYSFKKDNKSQWDNKKLIIGNAYIKGTDGYYRTITDNQVEYDKNGAFIKRPGLLDATWCKTEACHIDEREVLGIGIHEDGTYYNLSPETGKAYTLAPNVDPNMINKLIATLMTAIKGNGKYWIIGVILLVIILWVAMEDKD